MGTRTVSSETEHVPLPEGQRPMGTMDGDMYLRCVSPFLFGRRLFPKDFVGGREAVDSLEADEELREAGFGAGVDRGLPLGEQEIGGEFGIFMDQPGDAAEGLPLDDHQDGQEVEEDIRPGQEGGQTAHG